MTTGNEKGIGGRNEEKIRKLRSGRHDVILETIGQLRSSGSPEILPEVIELISSDVSEEITDACVSLLNDLKNKKSAAFIPEAIRQNRKRKNLDRIVAACWQNGHDYSKDIDLFIDLVLKEDYMTAIEAFTVVEENIHLISLAERERKAQDLESRFGETSEEKRGLVRELISVIKIFQGPFRTDLN